ncbi:hypothetical protein RRG08_054473 [Elysia crispata]|uniref:Uncharacterized protein n=1 Tax=Elysia crispata TaxID=231223 RepID=A0AAE0Y7I4_9GAST|nr:hypothetical protein RRG08_054473 [Elysia crispata]
MLGVRTCVRMCTGCECVRTAEGQNMHVLVVCAVHSKTSKDNKYDVSGHVNRDFLVTSLHPTSRIKKLDLVRDMDRTSDRVATGSAIAGSNLIP